MKIRRYAAVLSDHLKGRKWLVGDALSFADFSCGGDAALCRGRRDSSPRIRASLPLA